MPARNASHSVAGGHSDAGGNDNVKFKNLKNKAEQKRILYDWGSRGGLVLT
ncbi:hypothetical protein KKA09_00370 [Patescibacteria group bacterium]|nr:hypothetical protein [Patescibacteria group bacterium]